MNRRKCANHLDELPVIEMAEKAEAVILKYRNRCPCNPPNICAFCEMADKVLGALGEYTR